MLYLTTSQIDMKGKQVDLLGILVIILILVAPWVAGF